MQIKIAFVSFILSLSQEFRAFVLFVFCFYFRFVYPETKFLRAILALPRPIKRAQQTLTHTLTWAIVSLTHKYTFDCWTKDNEITKNTTNKRPQNTFLYSEWPKKNIIRTELNWSHLNAKRPILWLLPFVFAWFRISFCFRLQICWPGWFLNVFFRCAHIYY